MCKIIAACGNDCAACPRYTAPPFAKTEAELRRTAELWQKIGYRSRVVPPEEIACAGCSAENACRYGIARCCAAQGVATCASCADFPCGRAEDCFAVTKSFEPSCRASCTAEEYTRLQTAFFEKEKNLRRP